MGQISPNDVLDTAGADMGDEALDPSVQAAKRLNQLRVQAGLRSLIADTLMTQAAQHHADYLAAHEDAIQGGGDPHLEDPGEDGFTGENVQQRLAYVGYEGRSLGENVAWRPSAEAALQSWLETLYARMPLLDPDIEDIGVGKAGELHHQVFVVVTGTKHATEPALLSARMYPPNGAAGISPQWDGNELPQPAPPPGGYPSGPVLSLHAPVGPLVVLESRLLNGLGAEVPATLHHWENDPNVPAAVAALIPDKPLDHEASYTVSWSTTAGGETLARTGTFTTMPAECDALAQDCGHGRACYIQRGQGGCLWVGSLGEGASCLYMNDCSRGWGCYGIDGEQRCRRYCGKSGDLSCELICDGPHSGLDDAQETGFCW